MFQTALQGITYNNEYYISSQLFEKSTRPYVLNPPSGSSVLHQLHQGLYLPTPKLPTDHILSFPVPVDRGTHVK